MRCLVGAGAAQRLQRHQLPQHRTHTERYDVMTSQRRLIADSTTPVYLCMLCSRHRAFHFTARSKCQRSWRLSPSLTSAVGTCRPLPAAARSACCSMWRQLRSVRPPLTPPPPRLTSVPALAERRHASAPACSSHTDTHTLTHSHNRRHTRGTQQSLATLTAQHRHTSHTQSADIKKQCQVLVPRTPQCGTHTHTSVALSGAPNTLRAAPATAAPSGLSVEAERRSGFGGGCDVVECCSGGGGGGATCLCEEETEERGLAVGCC